ncbi:MAG: hypothetical protein ABI551_12550 [Polyangiaceae bacterium]
MNERDPARLAHDPRTSGLLREALRESKTDLPDDARLAAIALKLGTVVGAAGGGGAAAAAGAGGAAKASVAPAAVKAGASALSFKIAAAVAAAAVAIGGGVVVAPRVLAPKPAVTVAASTTMAAPTKTAPLSTGASDYSLPPASASAEPLPVPSATPSVKENALPPPNPDDEVKNLARAHATLATNPALALAICNDDASVFPRGMLAQEREVIAIDALTRLGRLEAAKARAKKLEAQYPGSADLPRVRQLVGDP